MIVSLHYVTTEMVAYVCLEPSKLFTVGKGTASRPLGDKTPFPNRAAFAATPGPAGAKLAALLSQTPGHLLRPSSMRQSTRRRSSGRPNVFETPMNAGDHWNVSDTEMEVDAVEEEVEAAPTDDYDEIEYMPPTAIGKSALLYGDLVYMLILRRCSIPASFRYARLRSHR